MPNTALIAELGLFLAFGALTTVTSFVFSGLRWLRPYAWRVWVGGSIGLIAGNVLLASLLYQTIGLAAISGMDVQHSNAVDVLGNIAVDFGPFVLSTFGLVGGSGLGFYLARRCVHGALPDNEKASP